ncbi:MAG: phage portal protein [Clostridia bacterium]|jgi:hypothetical protein|nr:phage portal protein [Clostridia bacterium]
MNILFINKSGDGAYLPHIPPDFEINGGGVEVEEVTTLDGKITVQNSKALKSFSISAMFPVNDYYWINKNANLRGWDYVRYFGEAIDNQEVLKVYILNQKGKTILYMPCIVESFSYRIDRAGDVQYTLDIKECASLKPQKVKKI